jgi:Cu/Ag efflux protein CusF
MSRLEELENKLRKMKEALSKNADMFGAESVNTADMGKAEVAPEGSKNRETYEKVFEKGDSCEDMAEEKVEEHEEEKHSKKGHEKEHKKIGIKSEKITLSKNGQWSLEKADDQEQKGVPKAQPKMQSMHGEVKNIDPKTGKTMSTVSEIKGVKLAEPKKD